MTDDTVQLIADGKIYDQWTRIEIDRRLETVSGAFDLGLTDNWSGAKAIASIPPQSRCQVRIGGENVITGFVDCISVEYDAQTHDASVQGRDATGDLVDCSFLKDEGLRQYVDIAYLPLIKALLDGFNIRLTVDPSLEIAGVFSTFPLQPAETVWEAIDRASRMMGVLTVSDGNGGLVLTRAGSAPANSRLKLGENIRRGSFKRDDKGRFSQYVVLGQSAGSDLLSVQQFSQLRGDAFDAGVGRFRPLIIMAEVMDTSAQLFKNRALWEASVRYGHAWRGAYTINSWRDAAGRLWQLNGLVEVEDELAGVNETLLIAGVKFMMDEEEGTSAEIMVTRREAFLTEPIAGAPVFDAPEQVFAPAPGITGSGRGR